MAYSIALFNFVRWEGPPPPLVKRHVVAFNKIGQAGVSAQLTGTHGDPFEVVLTAHYVNQLAAIVADETYRDTIGFPQELVYNNTNYLFAFGHSYLVTAVETLSMKAHPLLLGPTYSYAGGWKVLSRWSLLPILP